MPPSRATSAWRKIFNRGERLIGAPLEAVGQSPLVNTAALVLLRGQAFARRTTEEWASATVNVWGFASARDARTVLRRLADLERAVLDVEHHVDEATRAAAQAARPRGSTAPSKSRSTRQRVSSAATPTDQPPPYGDVG